ncbi:hypothetical protein B7494_g7364 [Chlorociboria aeruginascens]|nr:hypothetical protein B7494_g7364 [Chlorociboria aeruginascens]
MSPRRSVARATRAKPAINYAESSSESDIDDEVPLCISISRRTRRSQRSQPQSTPVKRRREVSPPPHQSDTDEEPPKSASKRRKRWHISSPKAEPKAEQFMQTSGVIPPWQTLPYHIFVQIFKYASYPLCNEQTFQPLPSGRWLLGCARLCRDFAEPALTVLYASPPLVPMDKAHMLVDLLKADPLSLAFKYRQKIESLRIDVGQVAAYSLPGSGHLDLFELVKNLPRLLDLEFYHQRDIPPIRDLEGTLKWTYPASLFDALEYIDPQSEPNRGDKTSICRLRSWRWSSRLAGKKYPIESMREVYLRPSFAALEKIAFVNYQFPVSRKGEHGPPYHEKILADSLSVLKDLKHVIFESSSLANRVLLPLLPTGLHYLEFINCCELDASDLAKFLLTHGSQLRGLTLNHNQYLSLSFLPTLSIACPKLRYLKMNLTYFETTYRSSNPRYKQLLLPDEIPTWPSTIQAIELTQLRKWGTEAAEVFFQSLLDNAANLPDLRKLVIRAILNIGWRDRASFRDQWVGSFTRVFKRISKPPTNFHFIESKSLIESRSSEAVDVPLNKSSFNPDIDLAYDQSDPSTQPSTIEVIKPTRSPPRRSTRSTGRPILKGIYTESPENSDDEKSDAEAEFTSGLSKRELGHRRTMERELENLRINIGIDDQLSQPSTPPSSPESYDSDDVPLVPRMKGKGKNKELIQGMCEIVDLRIDNLRPRETQVTEADFLDSEPEYDPDWTGHDLFEEAFAW